MAIEDPLWRAIRAAHERWSPDTAARFPPSRQWEPGEPELGTEKAAFDQELTAAVPGVPAVPGVSEEEARMEWEERAAILEFEGGFARAEAERRATRELGGCPEHELFSAFPHTTRPG